MPSVAARQRIRCRLRSAARGRGNGDRRCLRFLARPAAAADANQSQPEQKHCQPAEEMAVFACAGKQPEPEAKRNEDEGSAMAVGTRLRTRR